MFLDPFPGQQKNKRGALSFLNAMDDILAAVSRLQAQYQQLEERNKRLEAELTAKIELQKANAQLIEKQEKYLTTLERKVKLAEVSLVGKEKFVMEQRERLNGRVKLDVGGVHFTMSVTTLMAEADSMLAAMFSGCHELEKDDDG